MVSGSTGQRSAQYGQGTGAILLDQVQCNGNESRLSDCPANPIGQHGCSHFQDAGVTCSTGMGLLVIDNNVVRMTVCVNILSVSWRRSQTSWRKTSCWRSFGVLLWWSVGYCLSRPLGNTWCSSGMSSTWINSFWLVCTWFYTILLYRSMDTTS